MKIEEIRALLQEFQDGYTKRDVDGLAEIMDLFVPSDELEVIGTNTVAPGQGEWCRGQEATRASIKNDWEDWGDVVFDVQGAHITVNGTVAAWATRFTTSSIVPRPSTVAVISSRASSSAPALQ